MFTERLPPGGYPIAVNLLKPSGFSTYHQV